MKCYCLLDDLFIICMCHDSIRPQWGDKAQNSLMRAHPGHREAHFKTLRYSEMLKERDVGLVSHKEHLRSWRDQ